MKKIILMLVAASMATGCATARTKYSDKNMRVMIDPDSVDQNTYVKLQTALMQAGMWTVIDRSQGWKAIQREQERLHRDAADRYEDKEKFAHWGRMFGVGSVIVAHNVCQRKPSAWYQSEWYQSCQQTLTMVDTNTGEIILAVENESDGDAALGNNGDLPQPSWADAVEKMGESYPKIFKNHDFDDKLKDYQAESEKRAQEVDPRLAEQSKLKLHLMQ